MNQERKLNNVTSICIRKASTCITLVVLQSFLNIITKEIDLGEEYSKT
jgi:hypothetical protein